MRLAGVELGGTKCVCTLAATPREILERHVIATTSSDETVGAIERVLARWWEEGAFAALGVASFGPIDLDPQSSSWGHVITSAKPGWQRADVARRLGSAFAVPIGFDTDVNGAALAEMKWGAGQGFHDFAYVTVGTGVGVGLVVNGKPTRGFQHCEMGHIRIPRLVGDEWSGICPYHGDCLEGMVSGPAIKARLGGDDACALPPDHPVWDSVAHGLAQLCHVIACTSAPFRIVMGGGVVDGQPHLLPRIDAMLKESLAGYMKLPEGFYVTAPGLGADAGPLGPIALALQAAAAG